MAKQKRSSKKGRKGKQKKRIRKPAPKLVMERSEWLPIGIILAVTAIFFARTAGYEFVNWDDDFNIAKNPYVQVLDWASIKGIFSSHVIGNYNPLSTLSFAIENHFFGLDPSVYHITNVLLHLGCVFLVYRLSRLLQLPMYPALAVAALFALHPLRIESVAWVTERKDVLYSIFYLGALIQYVKWYRSKRKRSHFVWIVVLFAFSLLAKIQAVALPLSMLAIDYLHKRPLKLKLVLEKWLFFGMSLAMGLIGVYFLGEQGSLDSTSQYNLFQRLLVGMYSFDVYLIKFLAPYRISPLYPYPGVLPWTVYASPVLFAGVVYLAWIAFRRKWRPLLFGLAFFTFNVMFVLQVVGAGQGFLADRFTYMPYFGLMFLTAYYGAQALQRSPQWKQIGTAIAVVWAAALLFQTWRHIPLWKDSGALWTHVMQYYENTPLPYRNRAQYYRDQQQFDLALADYNKSISLKQDADVVNSRARLYFNQQDYRKAIEDYNLAIELDPDAGEFWINRGAAYAMIGDMQSALRDMTEGINRDPDFSNGYKNRSLVYQRLNQVELAHQDLLTYLELEPYDADIWYESARLYRQKQNNQAALEALNKAIRYNPNQGLYYFERSKVYLSTGQKGLAQSDLARAEAMGVQIDPQTRAAYQ